MIVITVSNFKGGSGKSTTAVFLAHAYKQLGFRVALVDSDPQQNVMGWADSAEFDIPTMGLSSGSIHRQLGGIVGDNFDIVVLDTPGFKDSAGIVYSAIRASDIVVVTMAPTMMELDTVTNILDAVQEMEHVVDRTIVTRVLLNRTVTNAASTDIVRDAVEGLDARVLKTTIPRREAIAQAANSPVTGNLYGHLAVAEEILEAAAEATDG